MSHDEKRAAAFIEESRKAIYSAMNRNIKVGVFLELQAIDNKLKELANILRGE